MGRWPGCRVTGFSALPVFNEMEGSAPPRKSWKLSRLPERLDELPARPTPERPDRSPRDPTVLGLERAGSGQRGAECPGCWARHVAQYSPSITWVTWI